MAAAAPALTPSSPISGSPLPARTAGSSPLSVDVVARSHLSPPPSPTPAPLSSVEPARNLLQEKYHKARCFFNDFSNGNRLEEARALFVKIIRDLPQNDADLLFLADCKIGLGHTYPVGDSLRLQFAKEAKEMLDAVYDKRSSWDNLDAEQKTVMYKPMRKSLEEFLILIPDASASFKADISLKIEECNRHISPLSDFYDKMTLGTQLLRANRNDEAIELFTQALKMIEGHYEPDYLLARACGTMSLASSYPPGVDREQLSLQAQVQTFVAYDQREKLFTNEKTKAKALSLFQTLLKGLIQLFQTDQAFHSEIEEKLHHHLLIELAECQRQIESLLPAGEPDSKKSSPGPKVTPNPVNGSWKTVKLFIAFSIAAAFFVGAAVLGRRFITRLN